MGMPPYDLYMATCRPSNNHGLSSGFLVSAAAMKLDPLVRLRRRLSRRVSRVLGIHHVDGRPVHVRQNLIEMSLKLFSKASYPE